MTLLVRLRCDRCGERAGQLVEQDGRLLWRYKRRRLPMAGDDTRAALRWEYGTATKGPRDGQAPTGFKYHNIEEERRFWDPRRPITERPEPIDPSDPADPAWREWAPQIDHAATGCSGAACHAVLKMTSQEVARALAAFELTGKPSTLRLRGSRTIADQGG